ncbi:MAG: NAD(P)/FAD-dependent oxidoreductase [Phycisphaerae bacterium]|nr:NAD(P)/FAD-dependent oxidoreductase [Gemmatimonadaceae bacterium]
MDHLSTPALESDVVVIGAGVVGVAVAARLARAGLHVVVIERHRSFGWEASSRNSEVVHAGMYYPTGSLKAQLCVAGNQSLGQWCDERKVPLARVGKFIVATSDDEVPELESILARGIANGVPDFTWADPAKLHEVEPNVAAIAALWSPRTGIVDSHSLMQSLADEAEQHDAALAYGATVIAAEFDGSHYVLRFIDADGATESIRTRRVVNAAGLDADHIAEFFGIDADAAGYRLAFVRGAYFRLTEGKRGLVKHLVYPVPVRGLSGLGIHVTVDLSGGIRFGPHVEPLPDRVQDYHVNPDLAATFATAASRYLPGLVPDDLRADQSGIRARRITPAGGSPDFLIVEETDRGLPGLVNMIGIESPGLTCCLELADHVAQLLAVEGPVIGHAHQEITT